jgi:hypothetical protein
MYSNSRYLIKVVMILNQKVLQVQYSTVQYSSRLTTQLTSQHARTVREQIEKPHRYKMYSIGRFDSWAHEATSSNLESKPSKQSKTFGPEGLNPLEAIG